MIKEIIDVDEIGEVKFVVSKRARSMRISVKPIDGVIITLPKGMQQQQALRFLEDKKKWVIKHLEEFKKKQEKLTIFDERTEFVTKYHSLKIKRSEIEGMKGTIGNKTMLVEINQEIDIYAKEAQEFIRKVIEETLRNEAKYYLPTRTRELASQHGFDCNNISVRNSKTRWGSCSSVNNITYSLHLMRLPSELQDYVILHELSHTIEKNHQPPFWNLLDSVTNGKAKELDRQVKQYSTKIY